MKMNSKIKLIPISMDKDQYTKLIAEVLRILYKHLCQQDRSSPNDPLPARGYEVESLRCSSERKISSKKVTFALRSQSSI